MTKRLLIRFKRSQFTPICIILLILLGTSTVIVYKAKSANSYAGFTYNCNPQYPSSLECLQKKYANIAKSEGVPTALAQLKAGQDADSQYCHQIAHAIGREAFIEYKTVRAAYVHGTSVCNYGYYHGVMEAAAKSVGTTQFNKTFTTICNTIPSGSDDDSLSRQDCMHGIGHGLMVANNDDLFQVLKLCDRLSTEDDRQQCYNGAFMENTMIVDIEGGESKYLKSSDPLYPCDVLASRYDNMCYLRQAEQIVHVTNNNYSKSISICAKAGEYKDICYEGVGQAIQSPNVDDFVSRTVSNCTIEQSQNYRENCISGIIIQLILVDDENDIAQKLCSAVPSTLQDYCRQQITNDIKINQTSKLN